MKTKTIKISLLILILFTALSILFAVSKIKDTAMAYIFAYPLVLMETTREAMISEDEPKLLPNHFTHVQILPDHNFRNVVRPNTDTLYSVAWLDLSNEPMLLSVPDTHDRYYVMPLMDAWTNVFTQVGKRTTGTEPGTYAITGPNWTGTLPHNVHPLRAPTNMVWIIGRIQTNGVSDIPAVAELQTNFLLTPLSKWNSTISNSKPNQYFVNKTSLKNASVSPSKIVNEMTAIEFFTTLSTLLEKYPASNEDTEALNNLASLSIVPGQVFDVNQLSHVDRFILDKGTSITRKKIKEKIDEQNAAKNGWTVYRDVIGNYGTHYDIRTGVAMVGLGALPPVEAAYPNTNVDSKGQLLSGSKRYAIHFPAGQTPPVNAFWSLSMYDNQGFFINNPIDRYAIGDRDDLVFNKDGSLDIYVQATAPKQLQSNWLPSPLGEFSLTLRLYLPKKSFLDASWSLPKIEPVNN